MTVVVAVVPRRFVVVGCGAEVVVVLVTTVVVGSGCSSQLSTRLRLLTPLSPSTTDTSIDGPRVRGPLVVVTLPAASSMRSM